MQRSVIAVHALAVALMASCATPTDKPITQTIFVETPGCLTASCTLSNDLGSWRVERTPGEVTVTSSREPLKVVCRSDGNEYGGTDASPAFPGTPGAGAVVGGIAGGAAVAMAVGSVALAFVPRLGALVVLGGMGLGAGAGKVIEASQQTVAYPPVISVALSCGTPRQAMAVPGSARVGVGFRGLSLAEAKALGLGDRHALLVTDVGMGSAGEAAGLRRDDVLLTANGQPVNDAAQLETLAAALTPGITLNLMVWRSGEELALVLLLPQAPP